MSAHLDDTRLLNQLEANLEPWLSCACDDKRIKEAYLNKWLDKVKIVDEKKCRERQQQRADVEEAACLHLKQNTTSAGLSEPSHCYNTFQGPANDRSSGKGKENTNKLPRLTDAERSLFFDNEGCLKCRHFFVKHRTADCPNNFPTPTSYKTQMNDDVNAARHKASNTVATVAEFLRGSGNLPVAAIMPPMNDSAVLEGDSSDLLKDSDDSMSTHSVLLSVPHYHWKCVMNNRNSNNRSHVEVLIDNSFHTVLIQNELVNCLGL
jgi:hypothetical protein